MTPALHLFWERGYASTSVADLMEATELTKGSLYKAFGDKRRMFLIVLERYLAEGRERLRRSMHEAGTPREGVERWMFRMARMATRGHPRKGCFGVNTCAELAPHDPEVRQVLRAHDREVEAEFERALRAAEPELAPGVDPGEAARMLRTLIGGLQVAGKASMDAAQAEATVRLALRSLWKAPGPVKGRKKE